MSVLHRSWGKIATFYRAMRIFIIFISK